MLMKLTPRYLELGKVFLLFFLRKKFLLKLRRLDDENGKKFDASRDRGQTFNFQLGAGQVRSLRGVSGFPESIKNISYFDFHLDII